MAQHKHRTPEAIELRGVRVHNLKNVDVEIPAHGLTVITGVSGSGKSSLAFDTLYAEGRRRYIECLSTYLQQFLERTARPDLDEVRGLPPALALERAVPAVQARSTVGSTTEISDYLRLLFARVGRPTCRACGHEVVPSSPGQVADRLIAEGGRGSIHFRIEPPRDRDAWDVLRRQLASEGFVRLWREDRAVSLEEAELAPGSVEVVVDRLDFAPERRSRLAEAVELAYRRGGGRAVVRTGDGRTRAFSGELSCADCGAELRRAEPRLFSPNSPLGACPDCQGFGRSVGPDLDRIIPDRAKTLAERPIVPWNTPSHAGEYADLKRAGRRVGLRWNVPYSQLAPELRLLIEQGGHGFRGLRGFFEWLETKTYKVGVRVFLARYRGYRPCDACGGTKLKPEALAFRVGGRSIADVLGWPVRDLSAWIGQLELRPSESEIAKPVLAEVLGRLRFLEEVGLGYLCLERTSRTLSGGEAQRIQLARALGGGLVDTLYVLDEPSVGLHPRDVERLIAVLRRLRDRGNTVVVVEHDPRVMREADWLIDLGPGAGTAGGRVLYQGPPAGLAGVRDSVTAAWLDPARNRAPLREARPPRGAIELTGVTTHNLRDIDAVFPRAALTVVTGVSGSGKSSLIHDTLHPALMRALGSRAAREPGPYRVLSGIEGLAGVELVDQSPIGRSPRSNPVTYVDAFGDLRRRFAATPLARARGLKPGYFSFNVPGGRCEACQGAGVVVVEMHFMPDLLVACEACEGSRFGPGALEVRDRGLNVAEVLEMTVSQALERYASGEAHRRLAILEEIGLGYLRLGQPAPTLSGGEAQRLKLAARLTEPAGSARVFLLDEPTTGLHPADVEVLVRLLRRLIERGHTVIVVEHHLDLIRAADWVIDLGPGAGPDGGTVVVQGPPAVIAASPGETGRYLARHLSAGREPPRRGILSADGAKGVST